MISEASSARYNRRRCLFRNLLPSCVRVLSRSHSSLIVVSPVLAQDAQPATPAAEPVNLFGFTFDQSERYKFGGELVVGWSHDGAQAALGFEKQGRVGMAILSLSGRVSDRVRYYVSVNPVSETDVAAGVRREGLLLPERSQSVRRARARSSSAMKKTA